MTAGILAPAREPQSAAAVLMVRPARFAFNPQTAGSNAYQQPAAGSVSDASVSELALREFDAVADALAGAGVRVIVAADDERPAKPDAVFPNNWVSFHGDGTVVLYPMMAPNRRAERREQIIRQVAGEGRVRIARTVDLTAHETEGRFLEGTGSLVLDRTHRVAYAALSARTHLDPLGDFSQQLDYELVTFDTRDPGGSAVYHTNVLMAVGERFAVLCGEAIASGAHRAAVEERLAATGHEVIRLTASQMACFAGNLLELQAPAGKVVALSTTAWGSLSAPQRRALESQARVLPLAIPVIERHGGGSVRCMLAEVHLPAS